MPASLLVGNPPRALSFYESPFLVITEVNPKSNPFQTVKKRKTAEKTRQMEISGEDRKSYSRLSYKA